MKMDRVDLFFVRLSVALTAVCIAETWVQCADPLFGMVASVVMLQGVALEKLVRRERGAA